MAITQLRNYVNGEWIEPAAAGYLDVENPSASKVIAHCPRGGAAMSPRSGLVGVALVFALAVCLAGCTARMQTCDRCASTRRLVGPSGISQEILYKGPAFATCSHKWRAGVSSAVPSPVPDGRVILIRKGLACGAFILRDQQTDPEGCRFEWWYRTDGKGVFGPDESSHFAHGTGRARARGPGSFLRIEFGPFRMGWSAQEAEHGFVYYDLYPGEPVRSGVQRICVTSETDVGALNAADHKWVYRTSPTDRGTRGDSK